MSVSLQARRSASAATKPATYTGTLARSFVTSCAHQRAGSDRPQALHSTSDAEDSPANPSPPPRATASTPQPGSKSFQNSGAPSGGVARRSSKPPGPGAPSALTTGISGKILAFLGLGKEQIGAMRTTRDLYEECAAIWDLDRDFWQGECHLPNTYQSWFTVTNLHVTLLLIRYRDLPQKAARTYQQELIDNFFIDAEARMRERFSIRMSRLVKGYMKELHFQQRGTQLAIDEALSMLGTDGQGDSRLAQALWRNMFGAGWGDVGGVVSKVRGVDKTEKNKDGSTPKDEGAVIAQDKGPSFSEGDSPSQARINAYLQGKVSSNLPLNDAMAQKHPELAFPIVLSRLTRYFLRELRRLAALSDHEVENGRVSRDPGPSHGRAPPAHIDPKNAASVGAGESIERSVVRPLDLHVQSEKSRDGDKNASAEQKSDVFQRDPLSIATFGRP